MIKIIKKSITVFLLFLLSVFITNVHANTLETILKNKTIRIAVPTDYPPFGFVGSDMKPKGIDIDMAKLLADKLGVKLDLIPVTAPNRIPYLLTNKADLTISSLGKTAERSEVIDFSIAYSPFFDAVFGSKNIKVESYDDLSDRIIGVTRGSMQDVELEELAPRANVKRYEDNNATLSAYMSGQVEMFASGTSVAAAIQQRNPNLDVELKIILSNAPCYVGIKKGEKELLEKVNEILLEAKKDGYIDQLSEKWLGAPAGDLPE